MTQHHFFFTKKWNAILCLLLMIGWIPLIIQADEVAFSANPWYGPRPLVVTFTDQSDYDPSFDRKWSFPGGTPSSGTGSTVVVTYYSAGFYDVTLAIWTPGGTAPGKYVDGLTKPDYIHVYELIDYGDAPDTTVSTYHYPTRLASDGASHIINNLYLGNEIDSELNGQPSTGADLDDNTDDHDEDGVDIGDLTAGSTNEITVVAHNAGLLDCWVDWGQNGTWAEPGDHAITTESLINGTNTVNLPVPADAVPGYTYARFRISQQGTNYYGQVFNGEVEDYLVYVIADMDWGDAKEGYPVTSAENGARHPVSTVYYLGETDTDSETEGHHSTLADWDNTHGINDETGAAFSILNAGAPASVTVLGHGSGFLHVWIDFNANDNWSDPGEQVVFGEIIPDGVPYEVPFNIPPGAAVGTTYARVRYSSDQRLNETGAGRPGEVEDYEVEISEIYDYGDAPDDMPEGDYPTLKPDGAAHPISQNIFLGIHMPDGEPDGQPNSSATGDGVDEDGVNVTALLPGSGEVIIPIFVNGRGSLHAWIDFDHSGVWEADEKFINGIALDTGLYPHHLFMPPDVVPGHTFARFRYSLDLDIGPTGVGQAGEVEDYMINIGEPVELDFGDAPAVYGNPSQIIHEAAYLGTVMPDAESTGQFSVDADGDDVTNGDEEGIALPASFSPNTTVEIQCTTFGTGILSAFFDWDINEVFGDPGETFTMGVAAPGNETNPLVVNVPAGAVEGLSYARFRFDAGPVNFAPNEGLPPSPDGAGSIGEVEDYRISIVIERDEDYGDAPAVYETGGDAFHTISDSIYMNTRPDPEGGPYSSPDASGDDFHCADDEELSISSIYPGTPYLIESSLHLDGVTGFLHGWIDFNHNDSWADPGEKVVDGLTYPSGTAGFSITRNAPADAVLGYALARFRLSLNQDMGPNGPGGDGEIEDYQVSISMDFGDVPSIFLPGGGIPASHILDEINQDMYLGVHWDSEFGPSYSEDANYDDNHGLLDDDEDGIHFGFLQAGFPSTVDIYITRNAFTSPTMFLNGWIDFDQDNSWDDLGEHVLIDQELDDGPHSRVINVPSGSPAGETFARFRLSLEPGVGPFGFGGEGEVEDYKVTVADFEADLGDAPDPNYPTLLASDGAYHIIVDGFHMGADVDPETDGQPTPGADGDTKDDGVVFDGDFNPGNLYHYTITTSDVGYINAWADYNGDGDWTECGEYILVNDPVIAGPNDRASLLPGIIADSIYFRFRYTREALSGLTRFEGGAREGEVEDYLVDLTGPGAPLGLKWTQPPLYNTQSFYDSTYWGWDEKSVYGDTLLADNWFCGDNRPVKVIRWWGSYVDWDSLMPPPEAPESFHLTIWSDDPIDPVHSQSQPGEVIWEKTVSRSQTGESVNGHDYYPGITVIPDSVFRYEVTLSSAEQFDQQEDSTYFWLSIAAVYTDETPQEHVWGWTTRETYLVSDAVQILLPDEPVLGSEYEEGNTLKIGWDCAFELLTDIGELPFDYGDAPDPDYPTSLISNGAHHFLWTGTQLGQNLDKEPDSPGDIDFAWDDTENTDDEDGITFHDTLYDAGDIAFLTVNTAAYGILNAWADYNGDGDWLDFGERVFIDMPCYTGNNNLAFNIPSTTCTKTVGMRFRIAPVGGLRSTGIAIGGEVEDMTIQMDQIATAVEESKTKADIPDEFRLMHNYPNPFNPSTTIPFHLPEMAEVKITIYDILGRHVRTLMHGEWSPGSHEIRWDGITDRGHRAATGIYIYLIECSGMNGQTRFVESHKMLLLK